ncbi:MAG: hypothetical protein KKD44_17230 [Proteobacteria bacterium]|nr:hypothetical protein [Pseudomonadota bacterium]
MKTIINFSLLLIIVTSIPLGFVFERFIRVHYLPDYSALMHLCAVIFLMGLTYALVTRNLFIFLITVACTLAIPYLRVWIVYYWHFNPLF